MAAARRAWQADQPALDARRLVFIDETATATNRVRPRGSRRRLIGNVPREHRNTTFVAALRCDGLTARFVVDAAMNGRIFRTYISRCLAPTLRPGDSVVMGNIAAHKVQGVREAIEARGARVIYLPPYSPDLNPIEQAFAKLKALLRQAAERSISALWDRIGTLIDKFTPEECRNYFSHAGYQPA